MHCQYKHIHALINCQYEHIHALINCRHEHNTCTHTLSIWTHTCTHKLPIWTHTCTHKLLVWTQHVLIHCPYEQIHALINCQYEKKTKTMFMVRGRRNTSMSKLVKLWDNFNQNLGVTLKFKKKLPQTCNHFTPGHEPVIMIIGGSGFIAQHVTQLQRCQNLTWICHNLTQTCHYLIWICRNLTRTCHCEGYSRFDPVRP